MKLNTRQDRNTISCSKSDHLNAYYISPTSILNFLVLHPFSSWDPCSFKSSLVLCFAFALSLSRKSSLHISLLSFLRPTPPTSVWNFKCLKLKKNWIGEVQFLPAAKMFLDPTEKQRMSWENEGKTREIRVGICYLLLRTAKLRISCTQLFIWFVILSGMTASAECLKWRGKKLCSGCLQNDVPITGVLSNLHAL